MSGMLVGPGSGRGSAERRFDLELGRPAPVEVQVSKCYGWLFDARGRVLLQRLESDAFSWGLVGGSPEPEDRGPVATLAREAREEAQTALVDVTPLGHVRVGGVGVADHAMVRLVGLIGGFGPRRADPDGGMWRLRYLASWDRAAQLLGWGDVGHAEARAAAQVAAFRWGLAALEPRAVASYVP